jgi:zinc protease
VRKYFGSIPAGAAVAPVPVVAPVTLTGETRLAMAARVDAPVVEMAWPTPPAEAPDDAALDLVAALLAGNRTSLLYSKLGDDMHIARDVHAHQASMAYGSEFTIRVTAAAGHTADEVIAAIDDVLRRLQAQTPTTFLIDGARASYLMNPLYGLQRFEELANRYAECEFYRRKQPCMASWLARYSSVAREELSQVAGRWLPLDRRVVLIATPTEGAPIGGELRGEAGGQP